MKSVTAAEGKFTTVKATLVELPNPNNFITPYAPRKKFISKYFDYFYLISFILTENLYLISSCNER